MTARPIRVVLTGAAGKMGREVVKAVQSAPDIQLVGAISPRHVGQDAGVVAGIAPIGLAIGGDLDQALAQGPDVLVDFTTPDAVMGVARRALGHRVRPVIGSTGLRAADLEELATLASHAGVGALVAPNFAIGALLMIQFAAQAARYFDHAEIVERHHNRKLDAPSGTALETAKAMGAIQGRFGATNVLDHEALPGARGGIHHGIHIHSVRLPGLLAHQEVSFGGLGQVLTIRHDATSRECYMPGVLLGIRQVISLPGLVVGLEKLMNSP